LGKREAPQPDAYYQSEMPRKRAVLAALMRSAVPCLTRNPPRALPSYNWPATSIAFPWLIAIELCRWVIFAGGIGRSNACTEQAKMPHTSSGPAIVNLIKRCAEALQDRIIDCLGRH
jgi:hypothetical protein